MSAWVWVLGYFATGGALLFLASIAFGDGTLEGDDVGIGIFAWLFWPACLFFGALYGVVYGLLFCSAAIRRGMR